MIRRSAFLVWYVGSAPENRVRETVREMEKRHVERFGQAANLVLVGPGCPEAYLDALHSLGYRVEYDGSVFDHDLWMGTDLPQTAAFANGMVEA